MFCNWGLWTADSSQILVSVTCLLPQLEGLPVYS